MHRSFCLRVFCFFVFVLTCTHELFCNLLFGSCVDFVCLSFAFACVSICLYVRCCMFDDVVRCVCVCVAMCSAAVAYLSMCLIDAVADVPIQRI